MEFACIQKNIDVLRPVDADYLIIAVGVRGPNLDCPEGNAALEGKQ